MRFLLRSMALCLILGSAMPAGAEAYSLEVLPPEHRRMTDPETGAELLFLTTGPSHDQNLYYEQRSWLADSSLILFTSDRDGGGLMGYIVETGELVRIATPKGALSAATAAKERNSMFAARGAEIVELALEIEPSPEPAARPSTVRAVERIVCTLGPEHVPTNTSLTENADGTLLAVGVGGRSISSVEADAKVVVIDVRSGDLREVRRLPGKDFFGHVVFSRSNPDLVSFMEKGSWLTVMDVREGKVVFRHKQVEGEFATHHNWWINDTITFCGGFHPQPTEDADVKVVDIRTGVVRIVGKGAWWPGATPRELAQWNWWHASGDEQGRWVAADNWHGDIGLFHAGTTRTYWLTRGHRTYGGGTHPEVGWDRRGERVIFASHKLGSVDVCVAEIPREWQDSWADQMSLSPAPADAQGAAELVGSPPAG
jgi:hypothetical protein